MFFDAIAGDTNAHFGVKKEFGCAAGLGLASVAAGASPRAKFARYSGENLSHPDYCSGVLETVGVLPLVVKRITPVSSE
jgi:hypothetical protein